MPEKPTYEDLELQAQQLEHTNAELKQSVHTLQKSEERLNHILENTTDVVWTADLSGNLTFVSPVAERMLGLPADKIRTMSIEERHPKSSTLKLYKALAEELEKEKDPTAYKNRTRILDVEHYRVDGSRIWVSMNASLLRDKNGEVVGLKGVTRDITKRKLAEEALRKSEEKLNQILENTTDVIWTSDLNANISFISPVIEKMTGMPAKNFLTMSVEERFPQSSILKLMATITEELERDKDPNADKSRTRLIDIEHFKADGSRIWVSINSSFIRDKKGNPIGLQGVTRDITELKILEEQLRQAQKMESVGRLAGGVAHDFNNMLGAILGNVEMMLEDLPLGSKQRPDLEIIQTAARRSADITRQLLAFASKQIIAPKALDLNQTVNPILKMLQRLIGEGIDISWQPACDLCPVKMDPTQVDQILANLCINARDAISGVGNLTIKTENVYLNEKFCAEHAGVVPGEYVMLTVSDNGQGMTKEVMSGIFEPFFTTKEVGKGSGLGLATVYGIVKQNNGCIEVHSQPHQGSTFNIYLPRHTPEAEPPSEKTIAWPSVRGNETIMLVEDEPTVLAMTKKMLERQGYIVLSATTPGEAITMARKHTGEIHMLLTDVVMPEMDGHDLAEKFQSLYPAIKRLLMSGCTPNAISHHGVLNE